MADKKKFIQASIKRPGALTKKAHAAGMSSTQFAEAHRKDKGLTGQEARFALLLRKMRNK